MCTVSGGQNNHLKCIAFKHYIDKKKFLKKLYVNVEGRNFKKC